MRHLPDLTEAHVRIRRPVRLILSRKGFDSSAGGGPSPILPDGRLLSLPIPRSGESLRYADVRFDGRPLGPVVRDLTEGRIAGDDSCHLDPDLRPGARPRRDGWRPLFGQAGAAATHLANQGVGEGDLFLFFGWFRRTEHVDGRLRFVPGAPDLHVVFGWLQVGGIHPRPARRRPQLEPWMRRHPHADPDRPRPGNLLFSAAEELRLGKRSSGLPGGGAFDRLAPELVLTVEGATRSVWEVPRALWRDDPERRLSYHKRPERWTLSGERARLRSVAQGQEFVLGGLGDGERAWIRSLLEVAA